MQSTADPDARFPTLYKSRNAVKVRRVIYPVLLILAVIIVPETSSAQQPRDFMVNTQPGGTYLNVDAVVPGVQLLLEHRIPIYGRVNEFALRANSLLTLLFYESQLDADLRVIVFTVGVGVGYRDTFRYLSFEEDEAIDREYRRHQEYYGHYANQDWGFFEGRINLDLPFNDYVLLHNVNTLRYETRPDTSFDWRTGLVHDGMFFRSDVILFFKHKDWGAIAPMAQVLSFDIRDENTQILNYGFFAVTRPGFRRSNDILMLNVLLYGATLNGMDYGKIYGIHDLFLPITFTLAYRMILQL